MVDSIPSSRTLQGTPLHQGKFPPINSSAEKPPSQHTPLIHLSGGRGLTPPWPQDIRVGPHLVCVCACVCLLHSLTPSLPLISLPLIASSTLSISPKHLREISDPILVLLTQLHKVLFLTQLPPNPTPSARWTLLQFYKRCLFKHGSSSRQVKTELHKLVNGSVEGVAWLGEGLGGGARIVQCALQEMEEQMGYDDETCTLTYEMLHRIIESLAAEHGYQDTHPSHTHLSEPPS